MRRKAPTQTAESIRRRPQCKASTLKGKPWSPGCCRRHAHGAQHTGQLLTSTGAWGPQREPGALCPFPSDLQPYPTLPWPGAVPLRGACERLSQQGVLPPLSSLLLLWESGRWTRWPAVHCAKVSTVREQRTPCDLHILGCTGSLGQRDTRRGCRKSKAGRRLNARTPGPSPTAN